ncbi:MAG TPA: hypothetical protein ENJ84_12280 [Gammaproteobacteria bacterium]|nr:hypothetical protein [Gammaproteobacteria bacterium]
MEFWELFRPHIYQYVRDGKIWVDPETGRALGSCPWLKQLPDSGKYICDIYYDRPADCQYYPVSIDQMLKDDCEMLDSRDLNNPGKAQKLLDVLMSDSRPPLE